VRYLVFIAAGVAAAFAAVALAASQSAHVAIAQTSPVVVTGAGFKKHERVTLTVSSKSTRTKRIVAGSRGGFSATFRGFSIARCVEYSVRAKGNRGSSAFVKVIPECAPARRIETTTDVGLPSDPGAPKKPH
jgi:hypothetical protein